MKTIAEGKKETELPKTATIEKVAFCAALIDAAMSSLHAFRDIFCEETSCVSSLVDELLSMEITTLASIDLSSVLSPSPSSNAETHEDDLCRPPDALLSIQQVKHRYCWQAHPIPFLPASTGREGIL